jgi:hypothetical protein
VSRIGAAAQAARPRQISPAAALSFRARLLTVILTRPRATRRLRLVDVKARNGSRHRLDSKSALPYMTGEKK